MFCQKTAWDVMHEQVHCRDEAANHQLPRCGLLNHLNNFCRGMFKLNVKFDADSLLYLLRHCECASHTVHMLTQRCLPPPLTSTVKSSSFTHVHSSPFSLAARYIDVMQTILVILTTAGLFPYRPRKWFINARHLRMTAVGQALLTSSPQSEYI